MKSAHLFSAVALLLVVGLWGYGTYVAAPRPPHHRPPGTTSPGNRRVVKPDAGWRKQLTWAQYRVMRDQGTEWPNSSPLAHEHRAGRYVCAGCGNPLFTSNTKFESGTGWPSFYVPIAHNAVYTEPDGHRTEVRCSVCDAHLGHVFTDGPEPTGLRYCMNGVTLEFVQAGDQ